MFISLLFTGHFPALGQHTPYYQEGPLRYDDHIYQSGIRSVRLVPRGNDLAMPVIALNSGQQLELSFDDLFEEFRDLSYTIIHCNADWTPSDLMRNDYLANFSNDYLQDFEYSLNTFVAYTHYRLSIPNSQVRLTKSGNYLLVVYRDNDPNKPILSRRFMVYEDIVKIGAQIKRATRVEKNDTHQEVDFFVSHGSYSIPNPFTDFQVVLLQNQNWSNAISDLKPQFLQNGQLIYQYDDENTFNGGNEYRFVDMKNLFTLGQGMRRVVQDSVFTVFLQDDASKAIERYSVQFDINGQQRIRRQDASNSDVEADYAWVDFLLHSPEEIGNPVFLYGEFSDWKLLPEYQMYYDASRNAYRHQVLLKQGFINYAYAVPGLGNQAVDLGFWEGDHWQTENQYQILAYHREIGSRYDRLVGFGEFNSDDLFQP